MKIYCVVWYDELDNDLSPCYGDGKIICVADDHNWDEVPLFTTRLEASAYVEYLEKIDSCWPPGTYRVYEVDCND